MVCRFLSALFVVLFSSFVSAQTPINQSNFPWSSPGSGSYQLTEDVKSSGTVIDIDHDNVTVLLNGRTLEWDGKGVFLDTGGHNKVVIRGPGRIVQGNEDPSASNMVNGRINGSNVTIEKVDFIFKATPNVSSSRSFFNGKGNNNSVIRDCTFDISGNGPWYLLNEVREYKFLNNKVKVHDWDHSSQWYYSRVFRNCENSEFGNNHIDIGRVHTTNVWIGWSRDNVYIHHNTVVFSSHHGRIVIPDQDCHNWRVEYNHITVNSPIINDAVYVFRVRVPSGGSTNPSTGHTFRHNFVDMSQSPSGVYGVSLGDISSVSNITIAFNIFKGKDNLFQWYGGSANDIKVSCNQFLHESSSGYIMQVSNSVKSQSSFFSNNLWKTQRGDGKVLKGKPDTVNWTFCDNQGFTGPGQMEDNISGVKFRSEGDCGNIGVTGCWNDAGTGSGPVDPPVIKKPGPPHTITVE